MYIVGGAFPACPKAHKIYDLRPLLLVYMASSAGSQSAVEISILYEASLERADSSSAFP